MAVKGLITRSFLAWGGSAVYQALRAWGRQCSYRVLRGMGRLCSYPILMVTGRHAMSFNMFSWAVWFIGSVVYYVLWGMGRQCGLLCPLGHG